jgi:endonuclease I
MIPAGEYQSIDPGNSNFISSLSSLINPHTSVFYSNYAPTMINLFEARDTLATVGANKFTRVLNCVYSGENRVYNEPFDWAAYDYSREHTYPHSWFPTNPADNPEKPEYNDQHNLYPARQSNVNATRCNYPLGVVVTQESNFLQGKLGLDANGRRVYEPRDAHKGRAARAMMYMAVCYNGISGNNWSFKSPIGQCLSVQIPYGQDQNVLKKWNLDFLPNGYDMARNDFLDSLQGNRNPFVDNPLWACYIDFSNMTYIANPTECLGNSIAENSLTAFDIFPNPAANELFIMSANSIRKNTDVIFFDQLGRTVKTAKLNFTQNAMNTIDISDLSKGAYHILIVSENQSISKKFVKQ